MLFEAAFKALNSIIVIVLGLSTRQDHLEESRAFQEYHGHAVLAAAQVQHLMVVVMLKGKGKEIHSSLAAN